MVLFFIYLLVAYFIGAIPTAIWYGRIFHKTDIRSHGSGNAGATNTFRTFGKGAGILVLLIDIGKGSLGVLLPAIIGLITGKQQLDIAAMHYPQLALGLVAALGHIYPIYEKFKGGKGVATLFGVIIALSPLVALCCVGGFVLIFIISRRVSLGSLISALVFAIAFFCIHPGPTVIDAILIIIYPLLIFYTHRSNIQRLMKGEEPKFSLGKKKT